MGYAAQKDAAAAAKAESLDQQQKYKEAFEAAIKEGRSKEDAAQIADILTKLPTYAAGIGTVVTSIETIGRVTGLTPEKAPVATDTTAVVTRPEGTGVAASIPSGNIPSQVTPDQFMGDPAL